MAFSGCQPSHLTPFQFGEGIPKAGTENALNSRKDLPSVHEVAKRAFRANPICQKNQRSFILEIGDLENLPRSPVAIRPISNLLPSYMAITFLSRGGLYVHMEGHCFDFNNLIIFELANNHQGKAEHGARIVREMGALARKAAVRAGAKLQLRDLDTFIHPAHRESKENKHIARFLGTRLAEYEFAYLVSEIKKQGMIAVATPFDEASVDAAERLEIDVLKIASCSSQDWPLLEKIAEAGKPAIVSVGGLRIDEIDRIVSFFEHRGVHFALMHCVAEYPTPSERMHLNQIEVFRNRYPGITIGFSTHEAPDNTAAVSVAYAKGARIFEKHVGIAADAVSLNAYSASPEQIFAWLRAYKEACALCGEKGERIISEKEKADLRSLMRGAYAQKDISQGSVINRADIFFAMPLEENQLTSSQWREGMIADRAYRAGEPLGASLSQRRAAKKDVVYSVIHAVKGMLNEARIPIGHEFSVELSHHYGLDNFHKTGCVIIDCVNREYAKKLIIQLPGQSHPVHYHKGKDETFQVLSGALEADIEGKKKILYPGDTLWVPRGVWHGFRTDTGVIFEEVSTTHSNNDSFYIDRALARSPRDNRKTYLVNWGRHQFD